MPPMSDRTPGVPRSGDSIVVANIWLVMLAAILAFFPDPQLLRTSSAADAHLVNGTDVFASLAAEDDEEDEDDEDEDEFDWEAPEEQALVKAQSAWSAVPAKREPGASQGGGGQGGQGQQRRRQPRVNREDKIIEAESLFLKVIDEWPNSRAAREAFYWVGECLRELGDTEVAIEYYLTALPTDGGGRHGGGVRLGWARCQIELGNSEEALSRLEEVETDYPESAEVTGALFFRGVALRDLARYSEAQTVWDRLRADYGSDRWAKRARNEADTLRPVRDRLQEWIPEFEAEKKSYLATPQRERRRALGGVQKILAKFASARAPETEKYLTSLMKKESGDIRAAVVEPLLAIGGPRSAKVLIAQLDSFDEATRVALMKGLRRRHLEKVRLAAFQESLEAAGKPQLQNATIDLLGRAGSAEAARILVKTIPSEDSRDKLSDRMRGTVDRIEGRLRRFREDKAISALGKLLKGRDATLRREVIADALGYTGSRKAEDALRDAMFDKVSRVAGAAVRSVGRLRIPGAAEEISHLLLKRRGDEVFLKDAVRALNMLDPTPAGKNLIAISDARDVSLRALIITALGKIRDSKAALDRIVEAFTDTAWQVRSAAIEASNTRGEPEIVEALVSALEREDGALRPAIVKRLIALLGVDKGPNPAAWREHWDFAKRTYDGAEALAGADGHDKDGSTYVRRADPDNMSPTYFGVEIVSKRLAFIVDVSGSMAEEVSVPNDDGGTSTMRRIDLARSELKGAVRALQPGTHFNILKFNNAPASWNKKLVKLSKKSVKNALRFADGLSPSGGTNIYDSLEMVLKGGEVDTIYLLSDGAPTAGRVTDPQRILEEIARLNEESQVTIHTIALGFSSGFMAQLAAQNKGEHIVAGQ